MSDLVVTANLFIAWIWVLLGFVSGAVLGNFFHREGWLGGYASFRRRMYRLAHISFFGLALMNLMFYVTVREAALAGPLISWASRGFVLGAVTMPVGCALMAHLPGTRLLFVVPVTSLLSACALTITALRVQ